MINFWIENDPPPLSELFRKFIRSVNLTRPLENTQIGHILQKYTLDNYTLEKYTLAQKCLVMVATSLVMVSTSLVTVATSFSIAKSQVWPKILSDGSLYKTIKWD